MEQPLQQQQRQQQHQSFVELLKGGPEEYFAGGWSLRGSKPWVPQPYPDPLADPVVIIGECLLHVSTFATTRVALPTGVEPG
jgi:hypothetical protein